MPKSPEPEVVQSVTLIIWGGGFDPRDITHRLGMRPSQAWRKGERKSYRGSDGVVRQFASVHGWSGWKKWPTERVAEASLERQLNRWVARLRPKLSALRRLQRRGISMELNCCVIGPGSVGTHLPADLLDSIGKLGVDLGITWYASPRRRSNKRLQRAAARTTRKAGISPPRLSRRR
jgi:hypothetical protein